MTENKKTALLAVSFGTSFNESRALTIDAIENALERAYPEYELRRAFVSRIIIKKILERDGVKILNPEQALEELLNEGFQNVIVQPTQIMPGTEYDSVVESAEKFRDKFKRLILAEPLLYSERDYKLLIDAMLLDSEKDKTVVWMGHGSEHEANACYEKLQKLMWEKGCLNHIIATVEAKPGVEEALEQALKRPGRDIIMRPLMIVAGDHANNDMAGEDPDSWKSIFEKAGFRVNCLIKGLGELGDIQNIFIEHTKKAIKKCDGF